MKAIFLNFEGKNFPYIETMGAMLSFKHETGIEASAITPEDTENNLKYIYHVVKAYCRRNKEEFNYTFEEFADRLEFGAYIQLISDINEAVMEKLNANDGGEDSKND